MGGARRSGRNQEGSSQGGVGVVRGEKSEERVRGGVGRLRRV